jgi:hypothetical protein
MAGGAALIQLEDAVFAALDAYRRELLHDRLVSPCFIAGKVCDAEASPAEDPLKREPIP